MSRSLSIIVPTAGRPSLAQALGTIRGLLPGDEVLVVGDGRRPAAWAAFHASGLPGRYLEIDGPHGDWGAACRNHAIPEARGEYLLFLDDDDGYEPGALGLIRPALSSGPRRPHLFRMRQGVGGRVLWRERRVYVGNVSTQMVAAPNVPGRLPPWPADYCGDHGFVAALERLYGGVVWREELVATWGMFDAEGRAIQEDGRFRTHADAGAGGAGVRPVR